MKIQEGMYVRTKKGIAKVTMLDYLDNVAWTDNKNIFFGITSDDYLTWYVDADGMVLSKPSFNLIDLIETGDYVNGQQIKNIEKGDSYYYLFNACSKEYSIFSIIAGRDIDGYTKPIENVVTKEQFEAMKYVVERGK